MSEIIDQSGVQSIAFFVWSADFDYFLALQFMANYLIHQGNQIINQASEQLEPIIIRLADQIMNHKLHRSLMETEMKTQKFFFETV